VIFERHWALACIGLVSDLDYLNLLHTGLVSDFVSCLNSLFVFIDLRSTNFRKKLINLLFIIERIVGLSS